MHVRTQACVYSEGGKLALALMGCCTTELSDENDTCAQDPPLQTSAPHQRKDGEKKRSEKKRENGIRISIYEEKIFGGIQENRTWRSRSDLELCHSSKESDVVHFVTVQRIQWAGHVVRMDEDHTNKKLFNSQLTDTRRNGRT
ncbi:uncharacterized protein TNCV_223171 [Trichonephila clavipes]|nr:uncharacterized protein TNCV_223171 [Trichonephila clavipes]